MYLVTGATGNVGSAAVDQLLALGKEVRIFTRNPGKATRWVGRVQVATGDFKRPESFAVAFEGVEAMFLMSPGVIDDPFHDLLTMAKQQGIVRVVFLSSQIASDPSNFVGAMLKQKEDTILTSGLEATFLRPGGFMSNIFQWAPSIKANGVVYNPMGTGQFPPIAPEDIAEVVVKALSSSHVDPRVHVLTGGELVTVPKQTEILSRLIGRPLQVIDITIEAATEQMVQFGLPKAVATGVAKSFEAIRLGRATNISDAVARITGHAPVRFEQWVEKHRDQLVG